MCILFITDLCGSLDPASEFNHLFPPEYLQSFLYQGLYSGYISHFEILLFYKLA